MSDFIGHECGIALVHLHKPLSHYAKKYGDVRYPLTMMHLLMEKQHNRGQDGAGMATVKLKQDPSRPYLKRIRSIAQNPISDIFSQVNTELDQFDADNPELLKDLKEYEQEAPYIGDVLLGHVRYGTHSKNDIKVCHPRVRRNNWRSRSLALAGNFNMTNVDDLFDSLVHMGQHPGRHADSIVILEKIGHFLDEESARLYKKFVRQGMPEHKIEEAIEKAIDLRKVLKDSCKYLDGGYAIAGVTGYGASFVIRDPAGIRPAYYYANGDMVVVTSEKPPIKTAFDVDFKNIKELKPGNALIIDPKGNAKEVSILPATEKRSCSFERIYFSKATDPAIYKERKELGKTLAGPILDAIDNDIKNTVISYIPRTAEVAVLGLTEELHNQGHNVRFEKFINKDVHMRTFIAADRGRNDLVAHTYDITYELLKKNKDTLVVLDDSIVRGTTMERSIITNLLKLEPKKIIVVSSAPQIRYPDCYGIDMSRMGDFVAFRAMIDLLKKRGKQRLINDVYKKAKKALASKKPVKNHVQELYDAVTTEDISKRIAQIITPYKTKTKIEVIYQTVEDLHKAIPNHKGDWYFTGNYPTPGGARVANRAFVNYIEKNNQRAY